MQLAPDPSKRFFTKEKNEKSAKPNPHRTWEPENYPSCSYSSQQVNNWPTHCREEGGHYQRTTNAGPDLPRNSQSASSQGPVLVEKRSYHISSVGDDGEEVIEEKSVTEDGFQVYHSSAYKKKMKRLEKLKNEDVLVSMKRKIATRFLLTKVSPHLSEKSVEAYILQHFDINEVYVRKNPMKFPYYCSFIFITNSDEEIDIDEYEQHNWPGEIKCFFAPRDQNNRN